jgi:hypothetical protein
MSEDVATDEFTYCYDTYHDQYGEFDLEYEFASNEVPWKRRGCPGNHVDGAKWDDRVDNVGAYQNRLPSDDMMAGWTIDPGSGVFEERAFAELWDYNNNGRSSNISKHIIFDNKEMPKLVGHKNERVCQKVAQIVIQWLGTNCGSCFVDEARRLGKTRYREWREKYRTEKYRKEVEREEAWERDRKAREDHAFNVKVEAEVNKRLEEIRIAEKEAKDKRFEANKKNVHCLRDVDLGDD